MRFWGIGTSCAEKINMRQMFVLFSTAGTCMCLYTPVFDTYVFTLYTLKLPTQVRHCNFDSFLHEWCAFPPGQAYNRQKKTGLLLQCWMIGPRFPREAWFNQHRPDPNFIALFDAQRAFRAKGCIYLEGCPLYWRGCRFLFWGVPSPYKMLLRQIKIPSNYKIRRPNDFTLDMPRHK